MLNKILSFIIFLSLTSCASNIQWVHPSKTQTDYEQDRYECYYEAKLGEPAKGKPWQAEIYRESLAFDKKWGELYIDDIRLISNYEKPYIECMKLKGYIKKQEE